MLAGSRVDQSRKPLFLFLTENLGSLMDRTVPPRPYQQPNQSDNQDQWRQSPQKQSVLFKRRLQQDERPITRNEKIKHLLIAVAFGEALANEQPQVAS